MTASEPLEQLDRELLERYVAAFESYDIDALTALIHEDATQSMPPFDLWLSGRDDILTWWFGPGIGCRGSRLIPVGAVNGSPAFAQYKPDDDGDGYERVGAAGARDLRRPGRGVLVLPRHRGALPAVRPAAAARRLAPRDSPASSISSSTSAGADVTVDAVAAAPRRELQPRERVDDPEVGHHHLDGAQRRNSSVDADLRDVLRPYSSHARAARRRRRPRPRLVRRTRRGCGRATGAERRRRGVGRRRPGRHRPVRRPCRSGNRRSSRRRAATAGRSCACRRGPGTWTIPGGRVRRLGERPLGRPPHARPDRAAHELPARGDASARPGRAHPALAGVVCAARRLQLRRGLARTARGSS